MLYRLIYNRFVASQMAPAVYETMSADIADEHIGLRFYGEHKVFAGFTVLYEEGSDETQDNLEMLLPSLKEGQRIEHNRFGPGTILELSGSVPDMKAKIRFDAFGEKLLLLKYAKIRPLQG